MSHRFGPRTRLTGAGADARVAQWMQRSQIISVQRGTVTITSGNTSATAALTAVVTANTLLSLTGYTFGTNDIAWASATGYLQLTNATTVTGTRTAGLGAGSMVLYFDAIQYAPGVLKSVQRGTVVSGGNATVTAVTMNKSVLSSLGWLSSDPTTGAQQVVEIPRITLTTTTNIACSNGNADANSTVSYQLAEFF